MEVRKEKFQSLIDGLGIQILKVRGSVLKTLCIT